MGAEDSQDVPSENRQGARRKEKWDVRGKRGAARGDTRQTQRDLPEWAGIKHQIRKTGEEGDQGLPPEGPNPEQGRRAEGGRGPWLKRLLRAWDCTCARTGTQHGWRQVSSKGIAANPDFVSFNYIPGAPNTSAPHNRSERHMIT